MSIGRRTFALLVALHIPVLRAETDTPILVDLDTTQGLIVFEVHPTWAPHGAARFLELVKAGYFDDSRFFRVRAGFIAQFGIAGSSGVARDWRAKTIPDDHAAQSNKRGYVAFAMTGKDTRSTQIYINLSDNTRLDAEGFAPFARVVEGIGFADKLYSEYGEASGGGMRTNKQDALFNEGNVWLDRKYPRLDRLVRVRIR